MSSAAQDILANNSFPDAPVPSLPLEQLEQLVQFLHRLPFDKVGQAFMDLLRDSDLTDGDIAYLGRHDRFFLLTMILRRPDLLHPWRYDRCREVEAQPDGFLDLWSRESGKSSIVTFGGSIQEIIKDPEITIGIFSHTRPIAKAFLGQLKVEFEGNQLLHKLYPEIFWTHPKTQAPKWSEDGGITVRRHTNPKEATVSAWGLVDGMPVSKHYRLLLFDDVVTLGSVSTPEQIQKTTTAWELAQHLSSTPKRSWHVGTIYAYGDTYGELMARNALKPRLYPATDDGTFDGKPVFLTQEEWDDKKRESSRETLACQMLMNPTIGSDKSFDPDWIQWWEVRPHTMNVYILCDPAKTKKASSDKTAIAVIGICPHGNKYLLDGYAHRMSLSERWVALRDMRKKWLRQPGVQLVKVGYEKFSAQADLDYFEEQMKEHASYFKIHELAWAREGSSAKIDRIQRLEPDLRNSRFFMPRDNSDGFTKHQINASQTGRKHLISKPIKHIDEDGRVYDFTQYMINNEYIFFPNSPKDDCLDAMSRLYDMSPSTPQVGAYSRRTEPDPVADY